MRLHLKRLLFGLIGICLFLAIGYLVNASSSNVIRWLQFLYICTIGICWAYSIGWLVTEMFDTRK